MFKADLNYQFNPMTDGVKIYMTKYTVLSIGSAFLFRCFKKEMKMVIYKEELENGKDALSNQTHRG